MKTTIFLILAACAATPQPVQQPVCPPAVAVMPAAMPKVAPDLDEATVKARSHAFFDAYDRASAEDLREMVGPAFVWYEQERFGDLALTVDNLKQRTDRHAPLHSRTWGDERVYMSGNSAVFVGEAKEHVPQDGDRAAVDEEGANTLVWVRTGDRWTVALWQWDLAGIAAEQQRWNGYLKTSNFNHKPNQTLVDAVKGRKPGTALDVNTGQGRNAIFLATQGWKVTGVDIADQGLAMAREDAAKLKVKLETVQSEIEKYDLGKDKWDLVTMIYAGNDATLLERIKPSVKKGGLFVTEYFAADSELAKGGAGGWDNKVLEAAFKDGWKIVRDDHVEDNADWAGQRKTKLVRFVAQKL
jgi:SAM-dependent methyltransferase